MTPHTLPIEESGPWRHRNVAISRLAGSGASYGPDAQSPPSSEQGFAQPARQSPDVRNIISAPDAIGPASVGSAPEPWRNHQREQLPPLSQLLPSEPPSASSRSPYSSPWDANSPKSPRPPSLSAAAGGYEAPHLQTSPFSERSVPRSSVYAPVGVPDRPLRTAGFLPPVSAFGGTHSRGAPEPPYLSSSYPDHPRHESRVSESAPAGGGRWQPRSEPGPTKTHASSYLSSSVGAGSTGSAAHDSPQVEPPFSGEAIGPSIWTGTHFLPRFLGERLVPGEGRCYFYDDGSHCKTVIDGEQVTAHWGVTKAGKPRKRLAVACLTCREKKIKCDPDYPKCVQCQKFGRVCKFKNA